MWSSPKVQNQHNNLTWKSAEEKARTANIKSLYKGYMDHISWNICTYMHMDDKRERGSVYYADFFHKYINSSLPQ